MTLDTGTTTATPASSGGGDFLEALRTQAIAAGHAAAATPAGEVTPAAEPDGVTASESTSAPAETPSPDSGPPAAVEGQAPSPTQSSAPTVDQDAAFWAQKHGVDLAKLKESLPPEQYASLEAALRAGTETNNRAAQFAKAAKQTATPEPTAQVEPEPASAPSEPAPAAADIKTIADEQLKAHPEVPQLSSTYDQLEAAVNKTVEALQPLVKEQQELRVLVTSSRVDDITKEEAAQRLREIGSEITGLKVDLSDYTARRDAVVQRYLAVKQGIEGQLRERQESEAKAAQQAAAFVNTVKTTLATEVQALIDAKTILPEDREVVVEQVRLRLASNLAAPDDPVRHTKDAVQAAVKAMDEFHRRRARQYAQTKVADAGSVAGAVPTAAATTPTTQPKDLESHLDALRLQTRRAAAVVR